MQFARGASHKSLAALKASPTTATTIATAYSGCQSIAGYVISSIF
jgi:hypothetical protein